MSGEFNKCPITSSDNNLTLNNVIFEMNGVLDEFSYKELTFRRIILKKDYQLKDKLNE